MAAPSSRFVRENAQLARHARHLLKLCLDNATPGISPGARLPGDCPRRLEVALRATNCLIPHLPHFGQRLSLIGRRALTSEALGACMSKTTTSRSKASLLPGSLARAANMFVGGGSYSQPAMYKGRRTRSPSLESCLGCRMKRVPVRFPNLSLNLFRETNWYLLFDLTSTGDTLILPAALS